MWFYRIIVETETATELDSTNKLATGANTDGVLTWKIETEVSIQLRPFNDSESSADVRPAGRVVSQIGRDII